MNKFCLSVGTFQLNNSPLFAVPIQITIFNRSALFQLNLFMILAPEHSYNRKLEQTLLYTMVQFVWQCEIFVEIKILP